MSLDVALDIIGTLRMMKIDEISEEKDENKKELLYKELDILTTWKIQCKLPPKTKRFCPLVLK